MLKIWKFSNIIELIYITLAIYFLIIILIITATHPIVITFYLVIISLLIGLFLLIKVSSWRINAIILIFLGGIIVLFIYISVLRNEDKITMGGKNKFICLYLVVTFFCTHEFVGINYSEYIHSLKNFSFLIKPLFISGFFLSIRYLLITLFSVVKITESFKGSLIKLK